MQTLPTFFSIAYSCILFFTTSPISIIFFSLPFTSSFGFQLLASFCLFRLFLSNFASLQSPFFFIIHGSFPCVFPATLRFRHAALTTMSSRCSLLFACRHFPTTARTSAQTARPTDLQAVRFYRDARIQRGRLYLSPCPFDMSKHSATNQPVTLRYLLPDPTYV